MARALNSSVGMKFPSLLAVLLAVLIAVLLFSACRGEPAPKDYQNTPPAVTHPATTSSQTPTANGLPAPGPEPSTGVEGKTTLPVTPGTTTTIKDQAPSAADTASETGGPPLKNSPHATQTTSTAVTGTHLAT